MFDIFRAAAAATVLAGAVIAAQPAEAGVGYYYSAPSYYYAPPIYPGGYGAGYYGAPAYGGYVPPYYGFSSYPPAYPAHGYSTPGWGYPTYGYISPYKWYGYRPYRYGDGLGLYDFDD